MNKKFESYQVDQHESRGGNIYASEDYKKLWNLKPTYPKLFAKLDEETIGYGGSIVGYARKIQKIARKNHKANKITKEDLTRIESLVYQIIISCAVIVKDDLGEIKFDIRESIKTLVGANANV